MARRRTFIGIGEALLAEHPDRAEPAGLALDVAMAAAALGHRGVPVSRLGQDAFANELLTLVAGQENVDRAHLQSDPDLPTGRLIVRNIAGVRRETLDHRAAFDNLQWDFDLVDLAKAADAAVFGMLAQRCGQSSSVIVRFASEARVALIACDLTNRADETFERALALRSCNLAHVAVLDSTAWSMLRLGQSEAGHEEASRAVMREASSLAAVVWLDPNQPMEIHTREGSAAGRIAVDRGVHAMALTAVMEGMLRGLESPKAVEFAERIVQHVMEHPDEAIPDALLG